MKIPKAPLLKYLLGFSAGIILAEQLTSNILTWIGLGIVGVIIIVFRQKQWTGLLVPFIFVGLGWSYSTGLDFLEKQDHYSAITANKLVLRIDEEPGNRKSSIRFVAEVIEVGTDSFRSQCQGKILVYLQGENEQNLKIGDTLRVKGQAIEIPQRRNPEAFNYKEYLDKKNIYKVLYLKDKDVLSHDNGGFSISRFSTDLRDKLYQIILGPKEGSHEAGIIKALLFGKRDALSQETISAFSGSGSMHILAVSGLHVGIVYLLIQSLLWLIPGRILPKSFKVAISLFLLWSFALVTGLKAPVNRAVLMLTLFEFGKLIGRKGNGLNLLAAAALVILLIDPNQIYDLGFQLSFSAVLSILLFYQPINLLIKTKNKILQWIWSLTAVAIAAQIGTIGISLFHFHQFPMLFFLSNIALIPIAYLMIALGMLCLIFLWIEPLVVFLRLMLLKLSAAMEFIVGWIDELPFSSVKEMSISVPEAFFLSASLFLLSFYLFYKLRFAGVVGGVFLLILGASNLLESKRISDSNELLVFESGKETSIAIREGRNCKILSTIADQKSMAWNISPWVWSRDLIDPEFVSLRSLENIELEVSGLKILVLRSNKEINLGKVITADIVISSTEIDQQQLAQIPKSVQILFDSSISRYWQQKNKEQFRDRKTYFVSAKGAYQKMIE